MLEYLLVRPADRESLFAGHRCRFVVLDEVHTYRGTLGTHVALLVRRLRAHLAPGPSGRSPVPARRHLGHHPQRPRDRGRRCPDAADTTLAVQQFFGRLVGVDPVEIRVIGEQSREVVAPPEATYAASPPPADCGDLSDPVMLGPYGVPSGRGNRGHSAA